MDDSLRSAVELFDTKLKEDDTIAPIAAMEVLAHLIGVTEESTSTGLLAQLSRLSQALNDHGRHAGLAPYTLMALESACELLMRRIQRDSAAVKGSLRALQTVAEATVAACRESRTVIARSATSFLPDGSTILLHGYSRCVMSVLKLATERGIILHAVVTEGRPDGAGKRVVEALDAMGVSSRTILDAGVAHALPEVDMVLVGADIVCESGGIFNKIGTLTVATLAHGMHKPVYVAAESYKFARVYPLSHNDIPAKYLPEDTTADVGASADCTSSPPCDYTPPALIRLLVTDTGILTPAAVSDELIRLHT
jgi:translation initiation factor eIF-2B subunit alpha